MKSQMTEREFRAAFVREGRGWGYDRDSVAADAAVAAAQEAGLEFAPEPPRLPDSLQVGPLGPRGVWIGQLSGGDTFTCRDDAARPLAEELVARYNAYRELREKATEALALMRRHVGLEFPFRPQETSAVLDALEAELSKGPK